MDLEKTCKDSNNEELEKKVEKLQSRVKELKADIYELLEDYENDTPISDSRVYKKYLD